jgi:hypothetical protein
VAAPDEFFTRPFRLESPMFRRLACLLIALALTGCIPYTVGTTAEPVHPGQRSTTMSTFVMPSFGRLDLDSARSFSNIVVDFETRWGLDSRSDVGVRVPGASGLIVNYKYLLTEPASRTKVAVMPGAGFVNLGQHAHFELSLVASRHSSTPAGPRRDTTLTKEFTPYGGLRVMQVAPLAQRAVRDQPTAGGFVGVRIGSADFGISPEVGVFYDHSALGIREGNIVVIPAINVHGERMIRIIGDLLRQGRGGIFAF